VQSVLLYAVTFQAAAREPERERRRVATERFFILKLL
jgi:hypothetical protein